MSVYCLLYISYKGYFDFQHILMIQDFTNLAFFYKHTLAMSCELNQDNF